MMLQMTGVTLLLSLVFKKELIINEFIFLHVECLSGLVLLGFCVTPTSVQTLYYKINKLTNDI